MVSIMSGYATVYTVESHTVGLITVRRNENIYLISWENYTFNIREGHPDEKYKVDEFVEQLVNGTLVIDGFINLPDIIRLKYLIEDSDPIDYREVRRQSRKNKREQSDDNQPYSRRNRISRL